MKNMKKIIKKLDKIAVDKVTNKYDAESIIKKVMTVLDIEEDTSEIKHMAECIIEDREHMIRAGSNPYITFKFCECTLCNCDCDCDVHLDLHKIICITDLRVFDDYEIIPYSEFRNFDKDKYTKRLIKISDLSSYNQIDDQRKALKEFEKELSDIEKHSNAEQIMKRYYATCDTVDVNQKINEYNDKLNVLMSKNNYAARCKEILLDISEEENIGYMSIEMGENRYEELNMFLHIDGCWVTQLDDTFNTWYEGHSIFGDTGLGDLSHFKKNEVRDISMKIDNTIELCRQLPHMYEVSRDCKFFDGLDDDDQRMISKNEVIVKIDKQLYLIEKHMDVIFGNLYKLLTILRTQKLLETEIK